MLIGIQNYCFLLNHPIKLNFLIKKASFSCLHLLNLQRYIMASPHRLLDALIEGGEKRIPARAVKTLAAAVLRVQVLREAAMKTLPFKL